MGSPPKPFVFKIPTTSAPKSTITRLELDDTAESSVGDLGKDFSSSSLTSPKRAPDADLGANPPAKMLKYDTQNTKDDRHRDSTNGTREPEEEINNEYANDEVKAGQEQTHTDSTNDTKHPVEDISDEDASEEDKAGEEQSHRDGTNDTNDSEEEISDADDPTDEDVSDADDPIDEDVSDRDKAGDEEGGTGEKEEPGEEQETDEEDDGDAIDLNYNPPPPKEVMIHPSPGSMVRIPRQLIKDNTKLLDGDPNAISIRLSNVSEDEFKSWRKEVEMRDCLSNSPWRLYGTQIMFKLLITDEKVNGRYWKVFMEKALNGLHDVINEKFLLTAKVLAEITERTNNLPDSGLFRWACNGLHHKYQLQGFNYQRMKHYLENYVLESTSSKASERMIASFEYLEKRFGVAKQGSVQLHPGRRIEPSPAGITEEDKMYAEETGEFLEKNIRGKKVV